MSDTQRKSDKALPGPQRTPAEKAAAVLALLDEDSLQKLAGRVPEKHRQRLLDAVRRLRIVDVHEQRRIAQEFAQQLAKGKNAVRVDESMADRLKRVLFEEGVEEAEDEPEAVEEPEEEEEEEAEPSAVWDDVAKLPVAALVQFFSGKSSSVLSIALSSLPDDLVSELTGELDEGAVKAAMLHLATNGAPNPVAVGAVEHLLREELLNSDDAITDSSSNSNADKVAGYLNRMVSSRRDAIMDALREELPEDEMAAIEAKVLSFPALETRLPRSAIPMVLRELDEKSMLTALKYGSKQHSAAVEYILKNISQRMAGQYREKMDEMPEVDEDTGERALSKFICLILSLADDGKIELLTPEG